MSHREQLRSPYQRTFQKECRAFVKRAEATANHARKYPDNHEIEPNSGVYKGLDLADQTEFEDECDDIEAHLYGLMQKVQDCEIEHLWVAEFLEFTSLRIQDQFHV
ncbi:uncharacterized protein N7487_007715 [Penicillium crustosum]|uniref:uncharacterized protein n=1 Tax=Penicillium crustosum TaxID=36656 RepID=UPI0023898141|nr:uncharacterized protein N7487_007715 [Penicillium crustosum]KAJ5401819.1 hypothetical protein N7487_007715 [Penicillium crustosum]